MNGLGDLVQVEFEFRSGFETPIGDGQSGRDDIRRVEPGLHGLHAKKLRMSRPAPARSTNANATSVTTRAPRRRLLGWPELAPMPPPD